MLAIHTSKYNALITSNISYYHPVQVSLLSSRSKSLYQFAPHSNRRDQKDLGKLALAQSLSLCCQQSRKKQYTFPPRFTTRSLTHRPSHFCQSPYKKSPHLKGGKDWSDHMIRSWLYNKFLSKLSNEMEKILQLGLFPPRDTFLNSSVDIGSNDDYLPLLLKQTNHWNSVWVFNQYYIAGSKMAGRLATMKPLEQLK